MSTLAVKKTVLNCSNPPVLVRVEEVNDPENSDQLSEPDSGRVRDVLVARLDSDPGEERVILGVSDPAKDLETAKAFVKVLRQTLSLANAKAQLAAMLPKDPDPTATAPVGLLPHQEEFVEDGLRNPVKVAEL